MPTMALSHSRLSDYGQCPRKFYLKYIEKAFPQEDDSPHLVRGKNVHSALENYVVKRISGQEGIPASSLPEVENTKPIIDHIFAKFDDVMPEAQIAVNAQWQQVEWFSKQAYYRAIIDFIARGSKKALVIDWKTGKINEYSGWGGQLHLTAAMIMSIFPDLEEVTTVYAYVDHQKLSKPVKFHRNEHAGLVKHFDAESAKVNSDTTWMPTANDFCKWCPATKAQCNFSRKM